MKNAYILYLALSIFSGTIYWGCESGLGTFDYDECLSHHNRRYNDYYALPFQNSMLIVGDSGLFERLDSSFVCEFSIIVTGTTLDLNGIDGSPFDSRSVAVGDSGIVIVNTTDFGESGTTRNLRDVVFSGIASLDYIAVGDSGTIIKSTDRGLNWYDVSPSTNLNLTSIERGNGGLNSRYHATGEGGIYLHSSDYGETWDISFIGGESSSSGTFNMKSLYFINSNTGWAAGENGSIFKTTNSGFVWFGQNSGISQSINHIRFNSYSYGYTAGDDGRVLFTTTGGSVWLPHPVFDTITGMDLKKFTKYDSTSFYLIGDSGTLVNVTTDLNTDPLSGIYSIGLNQDFENIDLAVRAADYLGVSDPVIFEILPGVYNEKIILPDIFGTDSIRKVKFKSSTNNPADVILTDSSVSAVANYTLQINSANHIIFENITIEARGINFGKAVEFRGNVSDVIFDNVTFNGVSVTGNSTELSVVTTNSASNTDLTDVTFDNCSFNNGSFGLRLSSSPSTNFYSGLKVLNCDFNNGSNACALSLNENFLLSGNTFSDSNIGVNIIASRNFSVTKNFISSINTGIQLSQNTVTSSINNKITNNFIHSTLLGISMLFVNSNTDFYYNTVNIENPLDTISNSASVAFYSNLFTGTSINNNVRNNLFINKKRGIAFSYSNSVIPFHPNSLNYNDYYANGNVLAQWQGINHSNLNSLRAANGRDTNSVSRQVEFISPTDLHLTGSSDGDTILLATPLQSINDDIDSDGRSIFFPYMGADEVASNPLPVELSFFNAIVNNRNVNLRWTTSTELNNYGFYILRKNHLSNEQWSEIGFSDGSGTTINSVKYSFDDLGLQSGKYNYKLKQVDFNGSFRYYNLQREVAVGSPIKFTLSQNYPNPFNPVTKISFDIPKDSKVTLKIFDITGREISTIINENMKAGYYTELFRADNLASGIYIYRLIAETFGGTSEFTQSKKMVLLK